MTYELHPLCTLFPRLADGEFSALVADIKANGLREPITTHDGMILDGGNRYRACVEAGVEPAFREFDGDNIVSYVLSANLHRRHLSAGQQAAIVASAQDWSKAHTQGRPDKGATLHLSSVGGRAAESGASLRTQKMADKVAKVDPELAKKVAHGEVSLPKAVERITGKARTKPEPTLKQELESKTRSSLPAAEPPSIVAQREPGPVTTPEGAEPTEDDLMLSTDELIEDIEQQLRAAQAQVKALSAEDGKAQLHTALLRAEHAERRRDEAMADSARAKGRADRYEKLLARIGRAVGERDLDKVAPVVEAMARKAKAVTQ